MKKIAFAVLMCCATLYSLSQNYAYRSAENPYYWKNRKPYEGYWQQDVHYKIKAKLDDRTDIISAEQELTYSNNSPDTLRELYFHLYQNAFIKGSYLEQLNLANRFKQQFGKYEAAGLGTSISYVKIIEATEAPKVGEGYAADGYVSRYDASYNIDFSIMRVQLKQALLPGKSIGVQIKFQTYFDDGGTQRRRMKLFKDNWGNKHYDVVHWYPRICVYDRKFGWETDQHLGKEFYGDFGSYDVELILPNHFIMDGTGVLQNKDEVLPDDLLKKLEIKNFAKKPWDSEPSVIIQPNGTTKTWKYKAVNTHDFAWTTDPTYRIEEQKIKLSDGREVACIALAQEPHASGWQDAAAFCASVIKVYSRDIGLYAYPKMIVVDARDGMEYPMLTLDGGSSPGYYGLFAHEIGHNWFFGMVGNNETYRASLDEGFTQFLTNWCMTSLFGEVKASAKNPFPVTRMDQTVYRGYIRDASNGDDMPLNTHSDDFNGALNHGGGYGNVYYKTATMLYNLQYVLGDELFLSAMQNYFNQWKMAHPYFEDFRNSIIQYTHVDLNWFFDEWMETTKAIDYGIWHVSKLRNDTVSVLLVRKKQMQMPLDLTLITKDSSVYSYHIPNTYFVKKTNATVLPAWKGWGLLNQTYTAKIPLPRGKKVDDIIIDPTYRLADIYHLDNSKKLPYTFRLDKGQSQPYNRKVFYMRWRPDVWYNNIDGIKAGLHFNSQYLQKDHIIAASVWYNTSLANQETPEQQRLLDFSFYYKTAVGKHQNFTYLVKQLDGLQFARVGWDWEFKKDRTVEVFIKSLLRENTSDLAYLLYPEEWRSNMRNNTINLVFTRNYSYSKGYGALKEGLKTTLFSDYDYSAIFFSWVNHHRFGKIDMHTRTFAQIMEGSNIAPESRLFVAGANPEELMDNKFTRSRTFIPTAWLGYGADVNHFHAGGGLNIRGYAGYVLPKNIDNSQVSLYAGNSGLAANIEIDIDRLIPLRPGKIAEYMHIDAYLFADAGAISANFKQGDFGLNKDTYVETGLLMSAGAGTAFTIKRWGKHDEIKPLTLRVDFPLFLNNTPFVDGEFLRYRWVVGVNRAF
jgi:aminopeptidase N